MNLVIKTLTLLIGILISNLTFADELPADCQNAIQNWHDIRTEVVSKCADASKAGSSSRMQRYIFVTCIRAEQASVQEAYYLAVNVCPVGTDIK